MLETIIPALVGIIVSDIHFNFALSINSTPNPNSRVVAYNTYKSEAVAFSWWLFSFSDQTLYFFRAIMTGIFSPALQINAIHRFVADDGG